MGSRIKIDEVRESLKWAKWTLLSDTYKNLQSDLVGLCPKQHEVHFTYDLWRKGKVICPICNRIEVNKINERPTKPTGNRIMAFDQATITSGWSVWDDGKLINYGKWTSNGVKSTQRISLTKQWFASMIESWVPSIIFLEDIQLQKFDNYKGGESAAVVTYKKLAHLQGVLKNYCYENGIPYEIVSPSTWRTFSGVKGRTRTDKKRSAQLIVKELCGIDVSDDIADAILIGRYASTKNAKSEVIMF